MSHSVTEFYLKWYQSLWRSVKKYVIIAIAVLIGFFIRGTELSMAAFIAAYGAAIAINMALDQVLSMIDDPYLKAAVAIAVTYIGITAGEFDFNFDTFTLADPIQLINVVNGVGQAYIGQQMKDLQSELNDFVTNSEDLWEECYGRNQIL